ncbi:MAG: dihydroneopterin aldolase, partial [Pseudomonadota bacterium]
MHQDTIFIRDLRVDAIIGIYDWERTTRQTVSIDIDMAADIRQAAETDDISHTPSYKDVAKRIFAFVEASEFFLIETMAEQIAQIVLTEFPVPQVRVTVHKPGAVSCAADVGCTIERGE